MPDDLIVSPMSGSITAGNRIMLPEHRTDIHCVQPYSVPEHPAGAAAFVKLARVVTIALVGE
jgi:hypothetical protein